MNAFSIYLLGVCLSGFLFLLMTNVTSFYNYLSESINESKNEMKDSGKYSDIECTLLDGIENSTIINFLNCVYAILSWIGLIIIIGYIIAWLLKIK